MKCSEQVRIISYLLFVKLFRNLPTGCMISGRVGLGFWAIPNEKGAGALVTWSESLLKNCQAKQPKDASP